MTDNRSAEEAPYCPKCGTREVLAPGIEYYCPNNDCKYNLKLIPWKDPRISELEAELAREKERVQELENLTHFGYSPAAENETLRKQIEELEKKFAEARNLIDSLLLNHVESCKSSFDCLLESSAKAILSRLEDGGRT